MKGLLLYLICALAFPISASAHVLDEYLQAAQITLAPDEVRVDLRFIPGVKVADQIFSLIDVDEDGKISTDEEETYAERVLQDIAVEVDGRRLPLILTKIQFPTRSEMTEGNGAIRLDFAAYELLAAGQHQVSFRNDHQPEIGVYLANALLSNNSIIEITGQQRDRLQHELQISFRISSASAPATPRWSIFLIFVLFSILLITQWKRLGNFLSQLQSIKRVKNPNGL